MKVVVAGENDVVENAAEEVEEVVETAEAAEAVAEAAEGKLGIRSLVT